MKAEPSLAPELRADVEDVIYTMKANVGNPLVLEKGPMVFAVSRYKTFGFSNAFRAWLASEDHTKANSGEVAWRCLADGPARVRIELGSPTKKRAKRRASDPAAGCEQLLRAVLDPDGRAEASVTRNLQPGLCSQNLDLFLKGPLQACSPFRPTKVSSKTTQVPFCSRPPATGGCKEKHLDRDTQVGLRPFVCLSL